MRKASPVSFLALRERQMHRQEQRVDLNVFVLTFEGQREAEKALAGGDPYTCQKCRAILNKYSKVLTAAECTTIILQPRQSLWSCEFCNYPNVVVIEKEEIPQREDVVYMLQAPQNGESTLDSAIVFCIDVSGSMNSTTELEGDFQFKYGLSKDQIDMLKSFMEPGDQAQMHHAKKTFVSRKQCILSAVESQLQQLVRQDPRRRVGFIFFNNEVTVMGDGSITPLNLLGDKLNSVEKLRTELQEYRLQTPLAECFGELINSLEKVEAKGQTALGPAIVASLQIAAKGSMGSSVIVCTDGLANVGVGSLDAVDEGKKAFYEELAQWATEKHISVSLLSIKGEGCRVEVVGRLAQSTNGNIRIVNPSTIAQDFSNVLKDETVGVEVDINIMLHRAMCFRNEEPTQLRDNGRVLQRGFPNATRNTKISFQYQLRDKEDLQFLEIDLAQLKTVPFQAQIVYKSPRGGKFLRVISSENRTTMDRGEMERAANLGVVHQRVTSHTANLFKGGEVGGSQKYNSAWAGYLQNNFRAPQQQQQNCKFAARNEGLNRAIERKAVKLDRISAPQMNQQMMNDRVEIPPSAYCGMNVHPQSQPMPPSIDRMERMECIMEENQSSVEKQKGFFSRLFSGNHKKKEMAVNKMHQAQNKLASFGFKEEASSLAAECQAMERAFPKSNLQSEDMDDMDIMNNAMEKQDSFE